MPRLSKLALLPATLSLAACLAAAPVLGQESPTSKMSEGKSDKLPPLDLRLAPGMTFDKVKAQNLITMPQSSNNWYRIPSWFGGTWHSERQSTIFARDERTDHVDQPNVVQNFRQSLTKGTFSDKTGQVWEFERRGYWVEGEADRNTAYGYLISRTQPVATDIEYSVKTQGVELQVDKITLVIKICERITTETIVRPISQKAVRFHCLRRSFDWEGNPKQVVESEADYQNTAGFKPDLSDKAPDGQPLYPLFTQFLKDHNMDDRIPDSPETSPRTSQTNRPGSKNDDAEFLPTGDFPAARRPRIGPPAVSK